MPALCWQQSPRKAGVQLEQIPELLQGLFSDPKATMYKAREEDCRQATMALAAIGIFLTGLLFMLTRFGFQFGIAVGLLNFCVYSISIYAGGMLTGGTGSPWDIAQLCGLVWLPLGIISGICTIAKIGFVGTIISWVILYYVVIVGHNFSSFNDVKMALAVSMIISFIAGYCAEGFLKSLAVAMLS